jgi:Domain of unknown function (DUF4129)
MSRASFIARTFWRSGTLAAFALAAGGARRAVAETARHIGQVAQDAIRRLDLQLDLPHEPETSFWNWHIQLPRALFWGAVILAAVVLLYLLVTQVLPGLVLGPRDVREENAEAGPSGTAAAETVAVAADELAQQGRFAEAMHALLLHSFAEIRRRRGAAFAPSLTSREILRRVGLSDAAQAALGDIVGRVERSYFGEHPAGPMDYRACRSSFDRLGAALASDAAA